ncbi:MAG: hypothetical protein IJX17_04120, partial [Clostridia bacterium]|nr:hypothetical protein [Clostridia bacterium]
YITLYSYWQHNLYNVIVDYRDSKSATSTSGVAYGSSEVVKPISTSNKFMPAYFDDFGFERRLSLFLPTRVGYDFMGWALEATKRPDDGVTYYEDPNEPFDYYKSTSYRFDTSLSKYLFTVSGLKVSELFKTGNDDIKEKFGDNDSEFYVYMFAVWKVQTFTINVSLNIGKSELKNLYDYDSEFALALYETSEEFSKYGYTGIKASYAMQNESRESANDAFTEIVANVLFEIKFDTLLKSAILKLGDYSYTLDQLYATSAGYYFLGWFSNPDLKDEQSTGNYKFIVNTKKSTYDEHRVDPETKKSNINNLLSKGNKGKSEFNKDYKNDEGKYFDLIFDDGFYHDLNVSYFRNKESAYNIDTNRNDYNRVSSSNGDDGIYATKKLSDVDYIGDNNPNATKTIIQNKYEYVNEFYTTMKNSSSESTNFGYVSGKYYIGTESRDGGYYNLYYINNNPSGLVIGGKKVYGKKIYLLPRITIKYNSISGVNYYGNISNPDNGGMRFRFDESNFYVDDYIVRFYETPVNGYNAYYVDTSYDINKINNINIEFFEVETTTVEPSNESSLTKPEVTLKKTREFSIYAAWEIKDDLSAKVSNANNTGTKASNNPGLSGYYEIKSSATTNKLDTEAITEKFDNDTLQIGYSFYDKVDLMMLPFFNGRFLSEFKLIFYAFEDVGFQGDDKRNTNKFLTVFDRVKYTLTIKFDWISSSHNVSIVDCTLHRETVKGNDLQVFRSKDNPDLVLEMVGKDKFFDNTSSYDEEYVDNNISVKDMNILSLLDRSSFNYAYNNNAADNAKKFSNAFGYDSGLSALFDLIYFTEYDSTVTRYKDEPADSDDGRVDINRAYMQFADLMTDIEVECKFSVQTFEVEIYNVFDPMSNTMLSKEGGTYYENVGYTSVEELIRNTKSAYTSSGDLEYVTSLSDTAVQTTFYTDKKVATISQNCAYDDNNESIIYNVPYACYFYGESYDEAIRPVDVLYDSNDRTGYSTSRFTGYDYIYHGFYKYG